MKKFLHDQYYPAFEYFHNTRAYNYLKSSHFIISQLLHFSLLNLKPHAFTFFNAGIPNCIYVVAGCYNKLFSELGKPFMFIGITKNPDYYNTIFGKVVKIKLKNEEYLIISNWRRLPTSKLTFMKDSYYSVLSSTMNSFMSCTKPQSFFQPNKYKNIFSLRTIISLCTNQKVSELLMDNRYAYMSSFSIYTNINKLLIEKFGPPYRSTLECWIVNRIITRLPKIFQSMIDNKINLLSPEFE
jgi:hypothetical protein